MSDPKKDEQEDKFTWNKGDLILEEPGEGPSLAEMDEEHERNAPED